MTTFSTDWDTSHRNRKSTWYVPGDWALPDWWTTAKSERGIVFSRDEYNRYFSNWNCSVTVAPKPISHSDYMTAVYRSLGCTDSGVSKLFA
jgi:hypothetical protein